jgi:hypothetical protein
MSTFGATTSAVHSACDGVRFFDSAQSLSGAERR